MMVKAILNRGIEALRRFRDDVRGVVLPFVGVLAILMVVVVGAGIDYGRAINEREVMAHALDASALALASQLSTTVMTDDEIEEFLKVMFQANLSALGYKDLAVENLTHNVKPDAGVVTVRSSVTMPTVFIGIGGIGPKTLTVGVNSEVNYSKFDVELALVLDVTGSMGGHMEALRSAAKGLVKTLIPDGTPPSDTKVKISIVPYSQGVNLGSDASTVTNGTATNQCVTERMEPAKFTDDAYNYNVEEENSDPAVTYYFGGGTDRCSQSELLPLTSDRTTLDARILGLRADAATAGQTGIAWGWYTLSPNWSNLWTGNSAPAPYNDDDVLKFAVIMTDGDFNEHYDYVRTGQTCEWVQKTRTVERRTRRGYEYVEETYWDRECVPRYGWVSDFDGSPTYNDQPAVRARAICDAIKDEKIEIFAIYFDTDGSDFGDDLMEYCASGSDNFYNAASSQDLVNAFGNIAKKIQAIYLAK